MSNQDFVKGECRHCHGHLEFPAEAAGQTIPCPHCGQLTELRPAAPGRAAAGLPRPQLMAAIVIFLVILTGVSVYFFKGTTQPTMIREPKPVEVVSAPPVTPISLPPPSAPKLKPGEVRTNNFDISPIKLEKTPGSSLVYVTGRVRNLTDHQRFGVKVEFLLSDTNHDSTGQATDYQSVIEAKGSWDFKAMVMESKTASAKFNVILEDQ